MKEASFPSIKSVEAWLLISRTWGSSLFQFLVHGYGSCLTGRVLIIVERLDGVVVIDTRANYRATFSAVVTINCRFVSECRERYASRMCHPSFPHLHSFFSFDRICYQFRLGDYYRRQGSVSEEKDEYTRTHDPAEKSNIA